MARNLDCLVPPTGHTVEVHRTGDFYLVDGRKTFATKHGVRAYFRRLYRDERRDSLPKGGPWYSVRLTCTNTLTEG